MRISSTSLCFDEKLIEVQLNTNLTILHFNVEEQKNMLKIKCTYDFERLWSLDLL